MICERSYPVVTAPDKNISLLIRRRRQPGKPLRHNRSQTRASIRCTTANLLVEMALPCAGMRQPATSNLKTSAGQRPISAMTRAT
jgi:hypothetical protein